MVLEGAGHSKGTEDRKTAGEYVLLVGKCHRISVVLKNSFDNKTKQNQNPNSVKSACNPPPNKCLEAWMVSAITVLDNLEGDTNTNQGQ